MSAFHELLSAIEQRGLLRHHAAVLPRLQELSERRSRFAGLTRPELAVLTAYAKIEAYACRLMLLHHVASHVAGGANDVCSITETSALAGIL